MSVLLIDSFDDGLMAFKWTSVLLAAVSTTSPRTGTHMVVLDTGAGNGAALIRDLGTDSHATIIYGAGVWFTSLSPTTGFIHFKSDAGATQHIKAKVNASGALEIYRGGNSGAVFGTLIASSAINEFIVNTWYHIEIKVVLADAGGSVEVRKNGATIINFSGDTKEAGTETVISRVIVGSDTTTSDHSSTRQDDVYILNGAGTVNNNFIGDSRVHNVLPNANGNYSQFVGSDGNSVDNYLLVDETPPNTTDYVGSGTSGNKDSYNFPSLPITATTVRAVGQRAYAANSDAGPRMARNLVRIGGVDYVSADYSLGATYLLFSTMFEVSPATAVAFTPAEFNGAEWGIECRA